MTTIGYARVSTIEQGLEVQVDRLKASGAEVIFSEKKSASSAEQREQLQAAIRYLREGDTLLVTKLDRFARNVLDACSLIKEIEDRGAHFRCLDQAIDTSGPMGRLMLHTLAAFAQFELDIRAERQREGIARAKAEGKYKPKPGQTPPGKLSWASRYLKGGMSYAQVAEKTGISVDTLQRKFPDYKNQRAVERERAKRARPEQQPTATPQADPLDAVVVRAEGPLYFFEEKPKRRLFGLLGR